MNAYVTGAAIKALREKNNDTQAQLAAQLCVSDKTVSKWETGKGLPDITLLEPLAAALHVSVAELLAGQCISNSNQSANLLRSQFYVCPVCGNVVYAVGQAVVSCCGIALPPLQAEVPDDAHAIICTPVETDHCITLAHPMTKQHFIAWMAYVTGDGVQLRKLYPEGSAETRFFLRGHGILYAYCNHHGLFSVRV